MAVAAGNITGLTADHVDLRRLFRRKNPNLGGQHLRQQRLFETSHRGSHYKNLVVLHLAAPSKGDVSARTMLAAQNITSGAGGKQQVPAASGAPGRHCQAICARRRLHGDPGGLPEMMHEHF